MYPRLILRLVLALLLAAHPALACTPPSIDTTASTFLDPCCTSVVALSTNHPNEIILYYAPIGSNGSNAAPPTVTGVSDTAALTWHHRFNKGFVSPCSSPCWSGNRNAVGADLWWAFSAGTLVNDTITPTFSFAPSGFHAAVALGIVGVTSSSAPWDANGSLPVLTSGEVAPPVASISTSHHADLIVTSCANVYAGQQCGTSPSGGYAVVAAIATDTLGGALIAAVYAKPTLPTLSSQAVYAGGTTAHNWVASGDALIGDDTGCTSPGTSAKPQVWINQ